MEIVLTLQNEMEASMMEEILVDKAIPHVIRSYGDTAYDGVFQLQYGWGTIVSETEYKEEIEKLYQEMVNSKTVN